MIRASALYISVLVSLAIVLLCGTLMMGGFIFSMQQKQQERAQVLRENILSGINILLAAELPADTTLAVRLFGGESPEGLDSMLLSKTAWGLYEYGRVRSWIQTDTVEQDFLMAPMPADSLAVLYISDEDRPVSISGKSLIKGTAYLPKSGIRSAYVEGRGYADKTLVHGKVKDSGRDMPGLDPSMLSALKELVFSGLDTAAIKELDLGGATIGRRVLFADSLIRVSEDTRLKHTILVAPVVRIEGRFKGNLQVFATDSILVGDSVKLEYPSALVLLQQDTARFQARLSLGKYSEVQGQLLAWQKDRQVLMPVLSLGDSSLVKGEVWSKGYVDLGRGLEVNGSLSAIRLMARHSFALYENYLIDARLDVTVRSRYYLSAGLFGTNTTKRKILCWLK